MKKFFAVLFFVAMCTMMLTACGGKRSDGDKGTAPEGTPAEIIEDIYSEKSVDLRLMTLDVDLEDADAVKYNLGLNDASSVKEAAVSEPMMGSQAYSLVVVRVNDAAESEKIAKEMFDGIDPRKWICVEADSRKVMTKGDLVLYFMVDSSFADSVTVDEIEEAFAKICGGSLDQVLE